MSRLTGERKNKTKQHRINLNPKNIFKPWEVHTYASHTPILFLVEGNWLLLRPVLSNELQVLCVYACVSVYIHCKSTCSAIKNCKEDVSPAIHQPGWVSESVMVRFGNKESYHEAPWFYYGKCMWQGCPRTLVTLFNVSVCPLVSESVHQCHCLHISVSCLQLDLDQIFPLPRSLSRKPVIML